MYTQVYWRWILLVDACARQKNPKNTNTFQQNLNFKTGTPNWEQVYDLFEDLTTPQSTLSRHPSKGNQWMPVKNKP